MNCHKVQNLISAYVDCELPGIEMLAVRQHLSECRECAQEFETLLRIKRSFGYMRAKQPSADLAQNIILKLDEVTPPAYQKFIAKLRQHLTVFPKTRLAAAGMSVFAMLLLFRSGDFTTTSTQTAYSTNIPAAQVQYVNSTQTSGMFATSTIELPTSSNISHYHSRTWEPAEDTVRSVTIPQNSGIRLISY